MPYSKIYNGNTISGGVIDDGDDFADSAEGEARTSANRLVPIHSPAVASPPATTAGVAAPVASAPVSVAPANNNTMNIVDEGYFDAY